jgi:hypothetical protein
MSFMRALIASRCGLVVMGMGAIGRRLGFSFLL